MKTREQIVRQLERMRDESRADLDEFADKLKGNEPAYALSWGANQFINAAEFEFAMGWLEFFNSEEPTSTVEVFLATLQREVLDKACYVSNKSSSVMSNYMDDCVLEVKARFLSKCRC